MAERPNTSRWNSEGARATLFDTERQVVRRIGSMWEGFKRFVLRDNVLEVALGLIFATAFTKVVTSLVSDILLPLISLLPFMSKTLDQKFLVLKPGPGYESPFGYNTREQAAADGAVIWAWGAFADELINFVGVGVALYTLAGIYGTFTKGSIISHSTRCPYCGKEISAKARRCALCTSWLDGREDKETSALADS